ncbi:MAG: ornithine decarboxylase [Magnetococcales bacterium]|nr:ornithine decarboxylase [Magnetococcales bacterium]
MIPSPPFDLLDLRLSLWQELSTLASREPFPAEAFATALARLTPIDRFWAFPGPEILQRLTQHLSQGRHALIAQLVNNSLYHLRAERYRQQIFLPFQTHLERLDRPAWHEEQQLDAVPTARSRPYFEVLLILPDPEGGFLRYRQQLASFRSPHDEFLYDLVCVDNAEDALTVLLANTDLQACVHVYPIQPATEGSGHWFETFSRPLLADGPLPAPEEGVEVTLCRTMRSLRPELDHYLISDATPAGLAPTIRQLFNRVLFTQHPFHDLHLAMLNGVRDRFSTPFFDALQTYSRQPRGVFHALPLSRGASVKGSPWIHDMLEFYGDNIFLAETSATQGGLDSLLDPTGAIKQAHVKAAESFGADSSYFVTNGTSTANKIVMQANLKPGDIVLISADCHKSIPYAVMLTGAYPVFLETYPLPEYDLYGGVDLAQIKSVMLDLKRHDRLDRLKQICLTNSTFDGLVYHSERYMMELLAIKPDLIFHWDEAWSAFAHFHPLYHGRTAMTAVERIRRRIRDHDYHRFYATWSADFAADPAEEKWQARLYPDPARIRLRVYVTQSTHKTLSAFRQGSMIHIVDVAFRQARFLEAFRIHTSTSPNYQLIASLDIARRQTALEGFHRVREAIRLAMQLRRRIRESTLLNGYFTVLGDEELIPACHRLPTTDTTDKTDGTGADGTGTGGTGTGGTGTDGTKNGSGVTTEDTDTPLAPELANLRRRWGHERFVIDPTRVTLDVGRTGLDGTGFRQLLMTRYNIQINKTSRNTVLFLINIGATQATIDYLLQVLREMASHERRRRAVPMPVALFPMPGRRHFHAAFLPWQDGEYPASDLRAACNQGDDEANVTHVPLSADTLLQVQGGRVLVSAAFVTPYPPGFPMIVPGQIITAEILDFFRHTRIGEIHGFDLESGFKVFREEHLARLTGIPAVSWPLDNVRMAP